MRQCVPYPYFDWITNILEEIWLTTTCKTSVCLHVLACSYTFNMTLEYQEETMKLLQLKRHDTTQYILLQRFINYRRNLWRWYYFRYFSWLQTYLKHHSWTYVLASFFKQRQDAKCNLTLNIVNTVLITCCANF